MRSINSIEAFKEAKEIKECLAKIIKVKKKYSEDLDFLNLGYVVGTAEETLAKIKEKQ